MDKLKLFTTPNELGMYIGDYLQEKGILLDINNCYNKLDDCSTNEYISRMNKSGFITVCSDSFSYSNKNIGEYPNNVRDFYKSIYNLPENIISVVDKQNPYVIGYITKDLNLKIINFILKNKEYSDIIMNTLYNDKPCTVKFNLIEYSNFPTANRIISIKTNNNTYLYPFNSWGGWKISKWGYNDIKESSFLSKQVKDTILNNYISIQFTTTNNKNFFENIIKILKKIKN